MLIGEYNHTIDAKGRLIIPSKYREELGEHFIVTKGFDGCLFVYDDANWQKLLEKLQSLPFSNKDSRDLGRFFMGSAIDGEYDKQGRVLLSAALRKHAELEKDVVLVGLGNHIEIWNKERWDSAEVADADSIAVKLEELGLSL